MKRINNMENVSGGSMRIVKIFEKSYAPGTWCVVMQNQEEMHKLCFKLDSTSNGLVPAEGTVIPFVVNRIIELFDVKYIIELL